MMLNNRIPFRAHWNQLRRQYQESLPLRMSLWLAVMLLVVHLILLCQDWRVEREEHYRRLAKDWLKLQAISRQTSWPERSKQADDVLLRVRERFWLSTNASQARADVQAWLDDQVTMAGVDDAKITVLAPTGFDREDSVARIEAQVRGVFHPESFSRLLHAIEGEPRQIVVDYLELNNQISPAINLQLSFLFLQPSQAAL
ncbi:GspMb/PilO family protein [Pseudomonas resinovorans]|uniref:GspMb/PilO family protein n=1 Tax=Metapseudomonas resinovorans TaxID=53412 RepID=UPI00237F65C6|nr:GspMb/PilO family protein [Pseudomonas resinovorans]MDE3738028.1 GspMb/PilO family protein [Pseudomonas resinovorans]